MEVGNVVNILGIVVAIASGIASVLNTYADNKKDKKLSAASLVVNAAALNLDKVLGAVKVLKK